MTLELRPKGDEEKAMKTSGREYLSRGEHRECKGPEVQVHLLWRGQQEAGVARVREEGAGDR